MTINQLTVTPSTVTIGKQVAVHWNVSYSTPAAGYTAEFHVNNQPSLVQGISGLTRVFSANGDLGPSSVGKDATVNCSYGTSGGRPALVCGSYGSRFMDTFDLTKPVYGIVKACTYNESMQQVCAEKSVALKFSSTAAKEVVAEGEVSEPADDRAVDTQIVDTALPSPLKSSNADVDGR